MEQQHYFLSSYVFLLKWRSLHVAAISAICLSSSAPQLEPSSITEPPKLIVMGLDGGTSNNFEPAIDGSLVIK